MRKLISSALFAIASLALLLTVSGTAQAATAAATPAATAAPTSEPATSGSTADYDKFVKGAEKAPGLFTVWRKDGKVYLEVRDDQLDVDYLEHAVPVNGLGDDGFHSGDQFTQNARLVRFHDAGKSLALIWPHTRFEAPAGTPLEIAVRESTADSVQALLPVVADDRPGKLHVVDLTPLLGDFLDLANSLNDATGADVNPAAAYHLDPTRTYFGPSKSFPQNVMVEADESFSAAKRGGVDTIPDPRYVQIKVKYDFVALPSSSDYMPRLYDDRVGYWALARVGFDNEQQINNNRFYLLRWNLQPSDPSKRISPPKKPIVFYLDRSIPMEYRASIRDGVLEWNKAFERIGISNALQVLDAPNDPSWDPDDIRNSVIRWVTDNPTEFGAEAQLVYDPRTGEIIRGGVLLDANLGRFAKFGETNLIAALTGANEPQSHGILGDEAAYGREFLAQNAFGATALELQGQDAQMSAFVYQRLKDVAMHEVGHDFGLSHNFIAHMAYSWDQLRDSGFTQRNGVSSSVMDYSPVNLWPKGLSHGTYAAVALGTYDYHVIHWGYASVPGAKSPLGEVPTLSRWASATTDMKYMFAGDEDGGYQGGHAIDPRAAPFVLTNRPLDWCAMQFGYTKHLIGTLDSRFPKHEEPWADERLAFLSLMGRYNTCAGTLTHYVGGEYLSRNRPGDPGISVALTPVPRSEQWKAFGLLDRFVFDDSNWNFSSKTLRRLVYQEQIPFPDGYGYDPTPRHDVPIVTIVNATQYRALASMFTPLVLERLADMPTKAAPGTTMSLADLFTWTQDAVFRGIGSAHPGGTQVRRNLQRGYARLLAHMVTAPARGTPYDAQALARLELADLDGRLGKSLQSSGLDLQTRAHLVAMRSDVERALDARTVLPPG